MLSSTPGHYLLCCFEHLSGLKINYHKSEIVCFGDAKNNSEKFRDIFTCVEGKLPMKYLGIPAHNVRLRNLDWKNAEEKMEKKLGTWQGRFLSYGGKLALIRESLSNVPFYMMSLFELPKGVEKKMDVIRKRLLWNGNDNENKYHLVNWETVCQPTDQGGLGVVDLRVMNISLLCKW